MTGLLIKNRRLFALWFWKMKCKRVVWCRLCAASVHRGQQHEEWTAMEERGLRGGPALEQLALEGARKALIPVNDTIISCRPLLPTLPQDKSHLMFQRGETRSMGDLQRTLHICPSGFIP
jgi:hypothetical protein